MTCMELHSVTDDEQPRSAAAGIRRLLRDHERSGRWLAKRLDRTHTYLWRRLTGEVNFDSAELLEIAGIFGVSVDDLYAEDSAEPVKAAS